MAIPERVLPSVDQAVIAAERTLPADVAGSAVQFRDDVAMASTTAGTAPAGHVRVFVTLRQMIMKTMHEVNTGIDLQ